MRGFALLLALAAPARAFPGLLVAKDGAERALSATTVVLMRYGGFSVVTLSAEYEGPLAPFAFVIPVPADVRANAVKTVRHGLLGRVEAVTAPRFHAFYEQDPCDEGPLEQAWDEHVKAKGAGFLAPPGLPPPDRHYAVSNEISVPVEPTFKDRESEFEYADLVFDGPDAFRAALAARGYRIADGALAALAREVRRGQKLLFAEVAPARLELTAGSRAELGGIRYFTHEPRVPLLEALGAENTRAPEDLFVFVFDREGRVVPAHQDVVFPPLAVRVEPRVAEHLATAYDGLFDAVAQRHPAAFVTEFAWSTSGCGEPCPDVPLAPDELMTLGGDVLEARTTSAKERAPEPSEEPVLERERFESHLAELMPKERPAAEREHRAERREIERRRALTARQTYVLTRLHRRYAAGETRSDLELDPAPPVSGGVGIPSGARGELATGVAPSADNRVEERFFALEPWPLGSACAEPKRWRWGKRWPSEARAPRAVPLALDLSAARRDPGVLAGALRSPLPELGLVPAAETAPAPAPSAISAPSGSAKKPSSGCSVAPGPARSGVTGQSTGVRGLLVAVALFWSAIELRRRGRLPGRSAI
ncbi:MAG TPA: DUF2330 domain-containing protein [Polyangiaceae bacterium]|nr:DUF2330 domain-containing protein [Polyangiaceae bacterium]